MLAFFLFFNKRIFISNIAAGGDQAMVVMWKVALILCPQHGLNLE